MHSLRLSWDIWRIGGIHRLLGVGTHWVVSSRMLSSFDPVVRRSMVECGGHAQGRLRGRLPERLMMRLVGRKAFVFGF